MSFVEPLLIAVIDDDGPFLALMRDMLTGEGYRVITRGIARDAVAFLSDTQPALLILDLVMETQEAGLELLHALRATPATANMPVLLCTANHHFVARRGDEVRTLRAEIILKPFMLTDMLDAVAQFSRRPA